MKMVSAPEKIAGVQAQFMVDSVITSAVLNMTFAGWLLLCLDSYAPMGKGIKNAKQAAKIAGILDAVDGDVSITFEDADFDVLDKAREEMNWATAANRRLVPFYEAMEGVETVAKKKE